MTNTEYDTLHSVNDVSRRTQETWKVDVLCLSGDIPWLSAGLLRRPDSLVDALPDVEGNSGVEPKCL